MIDLKNMDCMEYLKGCQDNQFDLAICDPPYGIGEDGGRNHSRDKLAQAKRYTPKEWDKKTPDREYFVELKRVSNNQIIWGANHFVSKIPFDSPCWIVWDKLNSGDFADCELAYTSFDTAVRKFAFMWNGMLQGNMKKKEIRIHPTQKPVALYKWLLTNYAKEGDSILDTHIGSASIAIACHDLKFDLVGCELDKEYFDDACKRLEVHQRQLTLF